MTVEQIIRLDSACDLDAQAQASVADVWDAILTDKAYCDMSDAKLR